MDVQLAISAYAQGLFPMDAEDPLPDEIPLYVADPRAIFEIDEAGLAHLRRKVRRSLAHDPGWRTAVDTDFEVVLAGCMRERPSSPGEWLTPRMADLYRRMHAEGFAHSFELRDEERVVMGAIGVVIGRAAMLESMFHEVPHAGNVGLLRVLELLAHTGIELCDIQMITDHTRRLGAVEIPRSEYEERLRRALRPA